MIYPEADKLENWGTKYSLVVLAAKRAKQIKSGANPLIDTESENPITIALEEIAAGKVTCVVPDNDIVIPVEEEPAIASLLAIESDADLQPAETVVVDEEEEADEEEEEEEEVVVSDDDSEDDIEKPQASAEDEDIEMDEKDPEEDAEAADEEEDLAAEDEDAESDEPEPEKED